MKKLDYYVLDVFTDQRYKGNQLSVVDVDQELALETYYDIAREFGYSETSFVHYCKKENVYKVRSFTPGGFEVAGAGHNLLGAVCLALLKNWDIFKYQSTSELPWVLIKDTKIPLKITEENGLPFVGMKQRPVELLRKVPKSVIARALGLNTDDIYLYDWEPTIVQTEVPHMIIPVKDTQSLKRAVNHKVQLKAIAEKYGFEGFYLFTTNQLDGNYLVESSFLIPVWVLMRIRLRVPQPGHLLGFLNCRDIFRKIETTLLCRGNIWISLLLSGLR